MRKTLSILLVLVLCLGLCACGSSQMPHSGSQISSDALVGKWTCERDAGQDNVSLAHTKTIELYKGGNCYCYDLTTSNQKYNNLSGKWELENGILTITMSTGAVKGYILHTATTPFTLTMQMDTSIVLVKQ